MSTEFDIAVPHHTILSRLGKGGMATVYLAREERLGRLVAVKVIDDRFDADEHFRKRFEREARTAAGLTHANIVPIYQYGFTADGRPFLTMAYLEGGSLRDRMGKRGPLPVDEALAITRQVAQALQTAHTRGIVHRDLKPDNVLFQGDTAMLTDFGIAKVMDASTELTSTGINPGTVKYFSPEQAFERGADQRSDIYTLGVVLYEMLTGQMPIEADSVVTFMMRIAHQPPQPLPAPLRGVQPFMDALLEKDPAQRLASCAEVIAIVQKMERNWARYADVNRLTEDVTIRAAPAGAEADDATMVLDPAVLAAALQARSAPTAANANRTPAEVLTPTMPMASRPAAVAAAQPKQVAVGGWRRWALASVAVALLAAAGIWLVRAPPTAVVETPATDSGVAPATQADPVADASSVQNPAPPPSGAGSSGETTANNGGTSPPEGVPVPPARTVAGSAEPPAAPEAPPAETAPKAQPAATPQPVPVAVVTPPVVPVGDLRVSVNAPAATVLVAGVVRGEASDQRPLLVRRLTTGTVDVEVRAAGYETYRERVLVDADARAELTALLQPDVEALLSGRWQGTYGYRDDRAPVPMELDLRVVRGVVSGSMVEVNTFGNGPQSLYADIAGRVQGNTIRFDKTYDGSGGYTHSVRYDGVLDVRTQRIQGSWQIDGTRGPFTLQRR